MVFWPRCPEQGIQFYSPLYRVRTCPVYGIKSRKTLTSMLDGFLFSSSVDRQQLGLRRIKHDFSDWNGLLIKQFKFM